MVAAGACRAGGTVTTTMLPARGVWRSRRRAGSSAIVRIAQGGRASRRSGMAAGRGRNGTAARGARQGACSLKACAEQCSVRYAMAWWGARCREGRRLLRGRCSQGSGPGVGLAVCAHAVDRLLQSADAATWNPPSRCGWDSQPGGRALAWRPDGGGSHRAHAGAAAAARCGPPSSRRGRSEVARGRGALSFAKVSVAV
jgi:hypothetical protein